MLSFEKTIGLMTQTSAGYNNCLINETYQICNKERIKTKLLVALSIASFLACLSVILSIKPRHLSA